MLSRSALVLSVLRQNSLSRALGFFLSDKVVEISNEIIGAALVGMTVAVVAMQLPLVMMTVMMKLVVIKIRTRVMIIICMTIMT